MTSWPEEPPTGQPQTRRQAREFARRAGTAQPTPAGQVPDVTTTVPPRAAAGDGQADDLHESDAQEPGGQKADAATRGGQTAGGQTGSALTAGGQTPEAQSGGGQKPAAPNQGSAPRSGAEAPAIPASAFAEPGVSSPSRDAFDLFRQGPDTSRPEPVTQPMAILQPSDAPAKPAGETPAAGAPAPAGSSPVPERTLTRRELRAMLQAQQANEQANHPATSEEQVFPVAFTSGPEAAAAKPEAPAAPSPETAAPSSEKTAWPFAPLTPSSASPSGRAGVDEPTVTQSSASPFAAFGAPTAAKPAATEPAGATFDGTAPSAGAPFASAGAPSSSPSGDVPSGSAPARSASAQSSAGEPAPASGAPASASDQRTSAGSAGSPASAAGAPAVPGAGDDTSAQERRPFTPPTGHWSTAAELDDQNQPITSRNVAQSTAATTTNALILPAIPQPSAAPLTSTGEILVTGSIDLPRGMGATGAHPDRIDSSDIDRLLDGEENEFNTSEVQPVRASRAISTHTSTRGVIAPPKKRGNALPVVLMVTAGVLAVGVIALLVAAYVLKVF
jgi:hypothetical protein